jgi:hypothetical protein
MKKIIVILALVLLHQNSNAETVDLKSKKSLEYPKYQVTITDSQLQQLIDSGVLNKNNKIIRLQNSSTLFEPSNNNTTEFDAHDVFDGTKMIDSIGGNW